MKLGVLFSGGKDSTFATLIAKNEGHEISCLIGIVSDNKESYMFHTPSIERIENQAEVMKIPLIIQKTKGEKEIELDDLKKSIESAIKKFEIKGIVTGAVESVYQSSRIQKICSELNIECFNPLWQKNQIELLEDLIKNKFEVVLTSVCAYPFDEKWLGRKIDEGFISEIKILAEKYKINPAGEGGEFESFVLDCPLFEDKLKINSFEDIGEKNSWRRELKIT
tara:strand:+ start:244 stop:912 length:669 start_codon:yes stop_codon:yes gene_type:complete